MVNHRIPGLCISSFVVGLRVVVRCASHRLMTLLTDTERLLCVPLVQVVKRAESSFVIQSNMFFFSFLSSYKLIILA